MENYENYTIISGTSGADSIYNEGTGVTIDAGGGNDTILNAYNETTNTGDEGSINAGTGADSIFVDFNYNMTIEGGAGNDTIVTYRGAENLINGGADDDVISLASSEGTSTIAGGKGNDTIYSDGDFGQIFQYTSGDGNDLIVGITSLDTITVTGGAVSYSTVDSNAIVQVGSGAITLDGAAEMAVNINGSIFGSGYDDTVPVSDMPTAGDDYLVNYDNDVRINALAGDDLIENHGSHVTIDGGAGNDEIINFDDSEGNVSISGGAGDDSIYSGSDNVTINGGAGSDYIAIEFGDSIAVDGGAGNDEIYNIGNSVKILAGDGDDTIVNDTYLEAEYQGGWYATLDGGKGNDEIANYAVGAIINAGEGDDTVSNLGADTSISGGAGKDFMSNVGEQTTIAAGEGNDTIYSSADNALIDAGAGDDFIGNGGELELGENYYEGGFNSTINAGDGNDTIINALVDGVSINGGAGNDFIQNGDETFDFPISDNTITAGAGDDTVYNYFLLKSYIDGGTGNDLIVSNDAASSLTVDGGDGNDTIIGITWNSSISGGAGNDLISLGSGDFDETTISGGTGNDTVHMDGYDGYNVYQYADGDGNDLITGFMDNDTLQITSGSISGSSISGEDVILTVGKGTITLKDYLNNDDGFYEGYRELCVLGADGVLEYTTFYSSPDTITGTADADDLVNDALNVVILGLGGDDIIDNYGWHTTISGGDGGDTIYSTGEDSSISGGAGNDFVETYGDNVTINGGTGNDEIVLETSRRFNVVQYGSGDGSDSISGFNETDTLNITGGTVSKAAARGKNVVLTVGSGTVTLEDYAGRNLNLVNSSGSVVTTMIGTARTLNGTAGADKLQSTLNGITISGGAGADSIDSSGWYTSISGGAGADTVENDGSHVTLNAGAGDDVILNNGAYSNIFQYGSGDGNDVIHGLGWSETIQITSGSVDSIYSSGGDVILKVGSGSMTLKDGTGRDISLLDSKGSLTSTILSGTITGSARADSIANNAYSVEIYGLAGNDTIENHGDNATLIGGDGADYLYSDGYDTSLSGGAGNDKIRIDKSYNTVNGGAGNDTIYSGRTSKYNFYQYATGDGNDVIHGFTESDTLIISSGSITGASASNGNVVLSVGKGTITLANYSGRRVNFVSDDEFHSTVVGSVSTVISGTAKADNLFNTYGNRRINALAGNDTIGNYGRYVTVDAGAGNDSIGNFYDDVSISAGAGNDKIENYGGYVTVHGGDGNDTLFAHGYREVYQYSGGKDVILGFDENDTLNIATGKISASAMSGSDFVISVGKGSITLKDVAAGDSFYLRDARGTVSKVFVPYQHNLTAKADNFTNEDDAYEVYALAGNDTVENYGVEVTLDGGAGNDYLYNSGEASSIIGGAGNDTIENFALDTTIVGGAGNDYIYTGSYSTISGGAGNDTIYSDGDGNVYQYGSGDGNDLIQGFSLSDSLEITSGAVKSVTASGMNVVFKIGNGAVTLEGAAGREITYVDSSDKLHSTLVAGVWKGTSGNDYMKDDGAVNDLKIDALGGNDTVLSSALNVTIDGGAGHDYIVNGYANMGYSDGASVYGGAGNDTLVNFISNVTLDGGTGHDLISIAGGSDSYQAPEVIVRGGKGNDTIYSNGAGNLIQYASGDGKDVVYGFSDDDVLQITSGTVSATSLKGADVILKIGAGNITLKNSVGMNIAVIDAQGKYLPVEAVGGYIDGTADADSLYNSDSHIVVLGYEGDDVIENYGGYSTITGGEGDDSIYAVAVRQTFVYEQGDGNDTITGFGYDDTLRIASGTISSIYSSGSNVIVQTGGGSITLEEAAGIYINIVDADGSLTSYFIGAEITGTADADEIDNELEGVVINALEGNDTISNYGRFVTVNAGAGNDYVYNAADDVTISGGDGNDTIVGSAWLSSISGGAGSDLIDISGIDVDGTTISGGAGNDTIYNDGYDGLNVFQYGADDGNDVIFGFTENDTLQLTSGSISGSSLNGSDMVLKVGSGSITLKDYMGDVCIDYSPYEYADVRHSNALWFTADDTNFIGGGASISEIVAQDYSVTNVVQPDSAEELAQIEKLTATYSGDR